MRPHLDAATSFLALGVLAFGGMAAAPAMAQAQVVTGATGDVSFSVAEIGVITLLLGAVVGGLIATFKMLMGSYASALAREKEAQAAILAQKELAHAEAMRLKDETLTLLRERINLVFSQLQDSQGHNNKQTDQLIILLTGVVKNNETSLKDMTGAVKEMTAVMTDTAKRDSDEHLAVLKAIETLAETRATERQQDTEDRAIDRQERLAVRDRLEERNR